jgi:hypothetical protein
VFVALGSNGAVQPDDFFDQAARLVLDQGLRALVVTGPGGRPGGVVGLDDVHVTGYVAFGEVMDRCRSAVHHAGGGPRRLGPPGGRRRHLRGRHREPPALTFRWEISDKRTPWTRRSGAPNVAGSGVSR